jgi:hypothetical protein
MNLFARLNTLAALVKLDNFQAALAVFLFTFSTMTAVS